MKFSTKEDIAAPMDQVFAAISDFESFERTILRRGVELTRTDDLPKPGVGMHWQAKFRYRGRTRSLDTELTGFEPDDLIELQSRSDAINADFRVELLQLSQRHTRLSVSLEIKPNTLTARLFVQSLKLAKSSLTGKFRRSVRSYASDLETRLGGNTVGFA